MGCLSLHQRTPSHPYRNEVPQHHRCDPPSSGLGYRPRVLSHQHGCGCGKFGTKRPQVQSCHLDQYCRRSKAPTRIGEGLSCCQYSNKLRPVQQQTRTLTCASKGLPQPALGFAGRHRAGVRIDLQRHRHVCVTPDPHDHPRVNFQNGQIIDPARRTDLGRPDPDRRRGSPAMPTLGLRHQRGHGTGLRHRCPQWRLQTAHPSVNPQQPHHK
jgi:hypothetical protein